MKKTFLMLFMGMTMMMSGAYATVYNDNKPAATVTNDDDTKKETKADKKKTKADKKKSSCCQKGGAEKSCDTKKQS